MATVEEDRKRGSSLSLDSFPPYNFQSNLARGKQKGINTNPQQFTRVWRLAIPLAVSAESLGKKKRYIDNRTKSVLRITYPTPMALSEEEEKRVEPSNTVNDVPMFTPSITGIIDEKLRVSAKASNANLEQL